MRSVLVIPSILSADLGRLGEQVREAAEGGADRIQVDVMDGHFVPNLTFGPAAVAAVKAAAPSIQVEAHLMVERPERHIAAFAKAGADFIQVHVEATVSLFRVVESIRELGPKPGVAISPATPVESLREILPYVEQVNVMTVEPGFGGQAFIATSPAKIGRLRQLSAEVEIEVDGGIEARTAPLVVAAGATCLVAGSAVFGHPGGVSAGIRALREAVGD
ncbi:MAG TPA: ribulose-phosphate 3-epimerase [Candidatus Dormibacteraeota bacterium]